MVQSLLSCSIVFQFSSKVMVLILLFTFFQFYFVVSQDSKVDNFENFLLFFLLIIIRSGLLAEIRWSVCMSESHRSLCVSFSIIIIYSSRVFHISISCYCGVYRINYFETNQQTEVLFYPRIWRITSMKMEAASRAQSPTERTSFPLQYLSGKSMVPSSFSALFKVMWFSNFGWEISLWEGYLWIPI